MEGAGCVRERIQRDKNRINVKSKRKRFLFKKAIELSQMCDLRILIVVHDSLLDRVTTYSSGSKNKANVFSPKEALQLVLDREMNKKPVKKFTDDDYIALSTADSIKKKMESETLPKKKRGRPRKE